MVLCDVTHTVNRNICPGNTKFIGVPLRGVPSPSLPPFPLSSFVDDPPVRSQSISVIWWLSCTKCYPTTSTASQFGPFILLSLLVSIICLIFSLDIWFHILLVAKSPSMGKAFCDTICFFLHRKVRCRYENCFIIHKSLQGSP